MRPIRSLRHHRFRLSAIRLPLRAGPRPRINVPMYLLSLVSGPTATVAAQAMGGEVLKTALQGGEFPFSPYSRKNAAPEDPNDPFGFRASR